MSDKKTIGNFKDIIEETELIKQYGETGYGSVEIKICAGEVVKVTPRYEFLFTKDYTLNPKEKQKI